MDRWQIIALMAVCFVAGALMLALTVQEIVRGF